MARLGLLGIFYNVCQCVSPIQEVRADLNLKGGTVSVDDSVLDKPYSHLMALVGYFWSGKHHRVVRGINLITLYYTDPQGRHQPINYRIYDKTENKTKNKRLFSRDAGGRVSVGSGTGFCHGR